MAKVKDPMQHHKCKKIAHVTHCGEGREFWVGKLTEPIEGFPTETHCLHIETPAKSVVFGINGGDIVIMAIVAQIVHKDLYDKPINQRYINTLEKVYRSAGREGE